MFEEHHDLFVSLPNDMPFQDALALLQAGKIYRCNLQGTYERLVMNAVPYHSRNSYYLSVKTTRGKPCVKVTNETIWQYYRMKEQP